MEVEILHTERCILRPATVEDAEWLFDLFNDRDIVTYIEGITWFNADISSVRTFIESMQFNAAKDLGAMWCVEYQSNHIGFILVYDLKDDPFLCFALLPEYRNQHLGSEVIALTKGYISQKFQSPKIDTQNPIVKRITRKLPVLLYLGDYYYQSLHNLRETVEKLNLRKKKDAETLNYLVALFRDGTLLSWLEYLSETGDGEAFDVASAIRSIPVDTREKELMRQLLNLFKLSDTTELTVEQKLPVRLLDNAKIDFGEESMDFNVHLPLNLNRHYAHAKLTLLFEITDISNDIARITIGDESHDISLKRKRKSQSIFFDVLLKDAIEQQLVLKIDGFPFHRFDIQSYPPAEWSDSDCIYHGIQDLYLQDYSKARLCFERLQSSAGLFLLGLMKYLGALGHLDADECLKLFRKAKDKDDGTWSEMANAFMAIMALKGEGHTMDDFSDFDSDCLPYGDSGDFIKKAVKGTLSSEEYESMIYSYNMADSELAPKTTVEIKGRTIQGSFNNKTGRLEIKMHRDWSELAKFRNSEGSTLHAYIGFKVNGEDWHYTIQDDWNYNTIFNTFTLDKDSSMWELTIDNVRAVHNIDSDVCVQQVNIIIRDASGKIKLEPKVGTCFIIDTYASRPHVALCNLTPLLFKLSGNPNPAPSIGIEYSDFICGISDSEIEKLVAELSESSDSKQV